MKKEEVIKNLKAVLDKYDLTQEERQAIEQFKLTYNYKKGEWLEMKINFDLRKETLFQCDHCESVHPIKYDFCPNCGTDMRQPQVY